MSGKKYKLSNLQTLFDKHPSQKKGTQIKEFSSFEKEWKNLWEELDNLETPTMYKAPKNPKAKIPDWLFSQDDLRIILQNRAKLTDTQMPLYSPYFRVFVDPESNNDEEPTIIKGSMRNLEKEKMRQSPPKDKEKIEDYAKRIFGTYTNTEGKQKLNKCGIIINTATKFHPNLIKKLRIIYEQLKLNMKVGKNEFLELDATIFMGNYGYTPLGIHQDRGFANGIIHFQCTPESGSGTKVMHLWGENEYKELTNIGDCRFFGEGEVTLKKEVVQYNSIGEFIKYSQGRRGAHTPETSWHNLPFKYRGFKIAPNNVFILPGTGKTPYHVGETSNFSIGFTILFTKWDKGHPEVFKKALNAHLANTKKTESHYTDNAFSVNKKTIIDNYVKNISDNYGFEPFDKRIK